MYVLYFLVPSMPFSPFPSTPILIPIPILISLPLPSPTAYGLRADLHTRARTPHALHSNAQMPCGFIHSFIQNKTN
jgi:hypothetical protein